MLRPYFCAYHSYLENMELLNSEERGRLFTALLEYSNRQGQRAEAGRRCKEHRQKVQRGRNQTHGRNADANGLCH